MKRHRVALAAEFQDSNRQAPIYTLITEVLRKALLCQSIEAGAVLLEGPLAELLRTTRTPVRQALRELEKEGLVRRFEGRGLLAGRANVAPKRVMVTAEMLGIGEAGPLRKTLGWEAIYDEVERDIVHLSVFEQRRINEVEMARHFGVGRMVARDVLLRLERLGLTEKDDRSRWVVTPLDADRINHLYELRWLLEPAALRSAMRDGAAAQAEAMCGDLRHVIKAYPAVDRTMLDALEHDLHVRFLLRCRNLELLQSLERTRCILTLSKHMLGESAPMPRLDPFMAEHLAVLEAVGAGDADLAAGLLREHLEASCMKVIRRAELIRDNSAPPDRTYID